MAQVVNLAWHVVAPAADTIRPGIELQLALPQCRGLAPLLSEAANDEAAIAGANSFAVGAVAQSGTVAASLDVRTGQPATRSSRGLADAWIGAEPRSVVVGGCRYHLSFVFLGAFEGEAACVAVDPALPVGEGPDFAERCPAVLTSYEELGPASRRSLLKWIDSGRRDADVPTIFLLHLVYSLEIAIVAHGRHDLAPVARAELEELILLHSGDAVFRCSARALIELCEWIDAGHAAGPIYASAECNHRQEMPFAVRRYLGEALVRSSYLESEHALLFLLKQPGTRLEAHVAQNFMTLHHHWTENYAYRFNGGIELSPKKSLSLHYECLDGETRAELQSDIPDPASAIVPSELRAFFAECCSELDELRDLPVAQQAALIKGLRSKPNLRGGKLAWSPRPDGETRVAARLQSPGPVIVRAADVLSDLFEDLELLPNKQVAVPLCRRMQRALSDIGIGFEPDVRYGLPARIRPDTAIALFFEEPWTFEQPSDAFHLAQAARTLSAIGTSNFPGLDPLQVADIEPRLPYRHRYSDRELQRLEASFLVMRSAGEPRALLKSWSRLMKRHQRVKDIDQGFGIAFHAEAGNPLVKRFATAVSKALHADNRRVEGFLREVSVQAQLELASIGDNDGCRAVAPECPEAVPSAAVGLASQPSVRGRSALRSPIAGLPLGLVQILVALLERPRSRTELNDIAFRQQLRVSGALEQLNDWSLANLNAHVTRGHSTVRINPELFEAVELLVRQP